MVRAIAALLCTVWAIQPVSASAHLLHEQNGTMKIAENSANFVISVPVSALEDVDFDGDGMLSMEELGSRKERIIAQFEQGFSVSQGSTVGRETVTLVFSPNTQNPEAPTHYVVVMHRVFFEEKPAGLTISFDLFGSTFQEQRLSLRVSDEDGSKTVILTPEYKEHTFF